MTTPTLRKNLIKTIEKLPKRRLEELCMFIEGDDEATEELEAIPGFHERLKKAEKEVREGKVYNWKDIREDIKRMKKK